MAKKQIEERKFPCECGKAFKTAEELSDHVHNDCALGTVTWKASEDYLAARAVA